MNAVSMRLPDELLREAEKRAAERAIPRTEYIRRAILATIRVLEDGSAGIVSIRLRSRCEPRASRSTPSSPRSSVPWIKREAIRLTNLGHGRGSGPGKTRPVLVVQSQTLLHAGNPSTLVVPPTTNLVGHTESLIAKAPGQGVRQAG